MLYTGVAIRLRCRSADASLAGLRTDHCPTGDTARAVPNRSRCQERLGFERGKNLGRRLHDDLAWRATDGIDGDGGDHLAVDEINY